MAWAVDHEPMGPGAMGPVGGRGAWGVGVGVEVWKGWGVWGVGGGGGAMGPGAHDKHGRRGGVGGGGSRGQKKNQHWQPCSSRMKNGRAMGGGRVRGWWG